MASKFSYPTGTVDHWNLRGLGGTKMPIIAHGSEIRTVQKKFVMESLDLWHVPQNPLDDEDTVSFRHGLMKQWKLTEANIKMDTHDDLADLLSELLYRMSVTHTQTHHNPICHSTMSNANVFPMQLMRGDDGDLFPAGLHHVVTMVAWDVGTEPMPHLDYPLMPMFKQFAHFDDHYDQTKKQEHAYEMYLKRLLITEKGVHEYNRQRCDSGNYTGQTGCLPYSCIIPRELLMSYGI